MCGCQFSRHVSLEMSCFLLCSYDWRCHGRRMFFPVEVTLPSDITHSPQPLACLCDSYYDNLLRLLRRRLCPVEEVAVCILTSVWPLLVGVKGQTWKQGGCLPRVADPSSVIQFPNTFKVVFETKESGSGCSSVFPLHQTHPTLSSLPMHSRAD